MEIRVYLNTGEILDFVQNDPQQIQILMAEVAGARLFSHKVLILGDGASCTLVRPSAISRVDVVTAESFQMPRTIDAVMTLIEDEETFRLRAKAATAAFREGVAPGEEYIGYMHFDMAGGHRVLIEIQRTLREQVQFFTNLNRIMDLPVLFFPHPRGGAVVVNVANVSAIGTAPGFTDYPKGALPVASV